MLALAPAAAPAQAPRAQTAAVEQAEEALEAAEEIRDGQGVRTGRELTGALRELRLRVRHLRGEALARATQLLRRPTVGGDTVCTGPASAGANEAEEFCVHGAPGGTLTAQLILAEVQRVHEFQTATLGWRAAPNDGDGRVDIYLENLAADKLFGYAEAEGDGQSQEAPSFLVLDRAYSPADYGGAPTLESLRLTLAHEYGHVLQYGYDITADAWHYESSATWLEHRMDPSLDDWLTFVYDGNTRPGWRSMTELPLTTFGTEDELNAKAYGSVVWNHYLSGRYGPLGDRLQRRAWESSSGFRAPSTRSYDLAIKDAGGTGLASEFARFAAAASEWQLPESGFALPDRLPADVERRGTLAPDAGGTVARMDHLTFALYDVPDTRAERIRLVASFPTGVHGAVALVARRGPGGPLTTRLVEAPDGGTVATTLADPQAFIGAGGRITAVLVNADASQRGFGETDWIWTRDGQTVAAAITSDLGGPVVTERTPAPDARRVATDAQVRVTFSKPVAGVTSKSFSLRDERGRAVPADVTYSGGSRTATLIPSAPLADTTRYRVILTGAITDAAATALPPTEWTFTTLTIGPRASLGGLFSAAGTLGFRLSSADPDGLRFAARLVAGGRTLARGSGLVRSGAQRSVRLRSNRRGRARLVVEVTDPQGNRRVLERRVRLRR